MSDVTERLSTEEMVELAALADGTLPADRRAEVEARVAGSPALQQVLERQRRAVVATQALTEDEVPPSLRTAVEARRQSVGSRRARSRAFAPRIALAGAAAVAAVVAAAILLTGGPGAPTVADAARLATQAPTAPAPSPAGPSGTRLAVSVEGVPFPNFARWAGWNAVGVRHGRVNGREATAVFYRKGSRRLVYIIVAGAGLPRPSNAQTIVIRGEPYQTLRLNGHLAVTWRRGGRTCVLIGEATRGELLRLASWQLTLPR